MCATATPLTATISSSTHSWQSSAGLPEEGGREETEGGTGVRKMKKDDNRAEKQKKRK